MKPVYLKMSAFGSYARETVIDFRKVNQDFKGNIYFSRRKKTGCHIDRRGYL